MRLTTATGTTFVKGVPVQDAKACAGQRWEVVVNHCVHAVGPRLRWHVVVGGWDLLGFEFIDGRHADLSPESADLPLVADTLKAAQALRPPETVTLPSFADCWEPYVDRRRLPLLRGDALLHTDANPHNLMVTGERAHLIDWATPALGAPRGSTSRIWPYA
ncbi:hypothetical protein RB200_30270 [Streptomyces sp. PmtG]